MRVEIIQGFSVDGKDGETRYAPGDIVAQGQRNWVDKGLAVETTKDTSKANAEPEPASAETPKG